MSACMYMQVSSHSCITPSVFRNPVVPELTRASNYTRFWSIHFTRLPFSPHKAPTILGPKPLLWPMWPIHTPRMRSIYDYLIEKSCVQAFQPLTCGHFKWLHTHNSSISTLRLNMVDTYTLCKRFSRFLAGNILWYKVFLILTFTDLRRHLLNHNIWILLLNQNMLSMKIIQASCLETKCLDGFKIHDLLWLLLTFVLVEIKGHFRST